MKEHEKPEGRSDEILEIVRDGLKTPLEDDPYFKCVAEGLKQGREHPNGILRPDEEWPITVNKEL